MSFRIIVPLRLVTICTVVIVALMVSSEQFIPSLYAQETLTKDDFRSPFAKGPYVVTRGSIGGFSHLKPALDFRSPVNTPMYAMRAGKVVSSMFMGEGSYGHAVEIEHGNGDSTLYGHLQMPVGQTLALTLEVAPEPEVSLQIVEICEPAYELVDASTQEIRLQLAPGDSIDVPWQIINPNDCSWDTDGVFMVSDTTLPTTPDAIAVPALGPNETLDLGVVLTAPDEAGTYEATWQMYSKDGAFVGDPLTVFLIVTSNTPSKGTPDDSGDTDQEHKAGDDNINQETSPPATLIAYVNPVDGATYIQVPSGNFRMGTTDERWMRTSGEQHAVYLDNYWIKQVRVTNAEYGRCVDAGFCTSPVGNTDWETIRASQPDSPVGGVSWYQSGDYAKWVGGRLPSEAEWEKACRGTDGRVYPWGNEPPPLDPNSAAIVSTMTGNDPRAASPYGVLNMAGTTDAEWTNSLNLPYPYDPADGREDTSESTIGERITRGGAFPAEFNIDCTYRGSWEPAKGFILARVGVYMEFRVVLEDRAVSLGDRVPLNSLPISQTEVVSEIGAVTKTEQSSNLRLLAFQEGSQGSLYTIREDGTQLTLLAESNGYLHDYAWSPDGAYMAYIMRTAEGSETAELYVVDVTTHERKLLAQTRSFSPVAWYGTRIAFVRTVAPPNERAQVIDQAAYIDLSDSPLRIHDIRGEFLVYPTGIGHSPTLQWSGDGKWLAADYFADKNLALPVTGLYPPREIGFNPTWMPAPSGGWEVVYIDCMAENSAGDCMADGIWRYDVVNDRAFMFQQLIAEDPDKILTDTAYAAFSPDGQRVAYTYPYLYLLDTNTDELRQLTNYPARQPAWSPQGDRILYAAWEEQIEPNRGSSYASVYALYSLDPTTGDSAKVTGLPGWKPSWQPEAYSPATDLAQQIAAAKPIAQANGEEVNGHATLPSSIGNPILTVANTLSKGYWAKDSRYFYTESRVRPPFGVQAIIEPNWVRRWDATTGALVGEHSQAALQVSGTFWSADATYYAAASIDDRTVRVFEAATGTELATLSDTYFPTLERNSLALGPHGTFWDQYVDSHDELHTISIPAETTPFPFLVVSDLKWSPDNRWLAAYAGFDEQSVIWDAMTGEIGLRVPGDYPIWSSDSQLIATQINEEEIAVWSIVTGQRVSTISESNSNVAGDLGMTVWAARDGSWSPDSEYLALPLYDSDLDGIWRVSTGELVRHVPLPGLVWSPDGRLASLQSSSRQIEIWSILEGHLLFSIATNSDYQEASWSSDSRYVAVSAGYGAITTLTYTPDDPAYVNAALEIWEAPTGKVVLKVPGAYGNVRWSPDGSKLLAAIPGGGIVVWNLNSSQETETGKKIGDVVTGEGTRGDEAKE